MKDKLPYIVSLSILGVGAYFIYKRLKKNKEINPFESNDIKSETNLYDSQLADQPVRQPITANLLPVASYPLKNGSFGGNVQRLQVWLNDKGYSNPKLVADGKFGTKTQMAVKNMQDYPKEKIINDYLKDIFKVEWNPNEVSQEFYEVFITKTRKAPITGLNTPLKF
jgi:hypothetical protein